MDDVAAVKMQDEVAEEATRDLGKRLILLLGGSSVGDG